MTVRAKFTCVGMKQMQGSSYNPETKGYDQTIVETATFQPVYGGTPENEKFFASTPCGQIEIGTVRQGFFTLGLSYYVDFTPAEATK